MEEQEHGLAIAVAVVVFLFLIDERLQGTDVLASRLPWVVEAALGADRRVAQRTVPSMLLTPRHSLVYSHKHPILLHQRLPE